LRSDVPPVSAPRFCFMSFTCMCRVPLAILWE
jgi:hypothetical protein